MLWVRPKPSSASDGIPVKELFIVSSPISSTRPLQTWKSEPESTGSVGGAEVLKWGVLERLWISLRNML